MTLLGSGKGQCLSQQAQRKSFAIAPPPSARPPLPPLPRDAQPALCAMGGPGLQGCGLPDAACAQVLRFDPALDDTSTGFFLAVFVKQGDDDTVN